MFAFAVSAVFAPLHAFALTLLGVAVAAPLRAFAFALALLGIVAVSLVAAPVAAQEAPARTAADVAVYFGDVPTVPVRNTNYFLYAENQCVDSVQCYDVTDLRVDIELRGTMHEFELAFDVYTETGTASVSNDNRKVVWRIPSLRSGRRAELRLPVPTLATRPARTERTPVAQYVAQASAPANPDPRPDNNKAVSLPVRLAIYDTGSPRLYQITPNYGVSVTADNDAPAPGDTVAFTITSHNYAADLSVYYGPGGSDDPLDTDDSMVDARVKIELSPGLEYQSHQITRPGWTRSVVRYDPPLADSVYDADSGIWEIGDYIIAPTSSQDPPPIF